MQGSFGIIFSENGKKVLLVKRRDIPIWVLPGGGIEEQETPEDAVLREVFEETGYHTKIIRKIAEYTNKNNRVIKHTFECSISGGEKTLSNESKFIEEFDINELPEMISPSVPFFISDALSNNKDVIKTLLPAFGARLWFKGLSHPWALFKFLLTKIGIHWNT